jgi:hypothetical protein
MNLGDAIALSAAALTAYQAGDDAALLIELNKPLIKTKNARGGLVTMAETSDVLGVELTAGFNFTIQSIVEQLKQSPNAADQAQALYLFDFRERFSKSDLGVDMSNDTLRGTLTALLTQAGWTTQQIAGVLDLGARIISPMRHKFGRDATEADIVQYRARSEYDQLWLNNVQQAYNLGDRAAMITGLKAVATGLE